MSFIICISNFKDIYRHLHINGWILKILLLSYHIFLTLLTLKIKDVYEYLLFQMVQKSFLYLAHMSYQLQIGSMAEGYSYLSREFVNVMHARTLEFQMK